MSTKGFIMLTTLVIVAAACSRQKAPLADRPGFVSKTEEEWKKELTAEQYHVLREKGTERAFTGALLRTHDDGVYTCAACHQLLFSSDTKFDSGTGWPSFWKPVSDTLISIGMDAGDPDLQEVVCSRCGGHLGHVFEDGPEPTGLRYCINSLALEFNE